MGWCIRNGRQYYYRLVKVNGRWSKQYVGPAGSAADLVAECDQACLEQRVQARQLQRQERAYRHTLEAMLDRLNSWIRLMIHATLLMAGYHRQERSHWRKRL